MPIFLDDLIENFYEPVGPQFRGAYERGQIFWAHIGYTREDLQLWRPAGLDTSQTSANHFKIEQAGADAFSRSLPLYTPRLEIREEFIVVKAKKRPVILVSPAPGNRGIPNLRRGGRIYRSLCVVAPVYSLVSQDSGEVKYPQAFINKIRMLAFPEFLFLPEAPGVLRCASYARLGEFQSVYQPHLEPCNLRLREEVRHILEGQVQFLISGIYGQEFEMYREQLLNQEG